MPTNFQSRVPHVQPNSDVSAGNTSAATRALEARTNYLRDMLAQAAAGATLQLDDQPLSPDVLSGQVVYWDSSNARFAQALAAVSTDANGALLLLDTADAIGIVLDKRAGNVGRVGLFGLFALTPEQTNNLIGDVQPVAGRYYLSAAAPGHAVQQRPPVTVVVARIFSPPADCDSRVLVFFAPQLRDFVEDHVHYQFELVAAPAGDHQPPAEDQVHVITNPDAEKQGWLPADHESFQDRAPPGAVFGYNLLAQPALFAAWPPLPPASAVLETFRDDPGFPTASRVLSSHVLFDRNGIWWLTDCYGQVPWPTLLDTAEPAGSASSACPDPDMELILSFLKMTFASDKTVVTSLQPDTDQPIEFVNCDDVPATTGDLKARLNILALITAEDKLGGQALKTIETGQLGFGRGWVTEGLVAGSSRVLLQSSHSRHLDPEDTESSLVHQGVVTVDVETEAGERELTPQVIKLGDAMEREFRDLLYIGFPTGRDSGIRLNFYVPTLGLPDNPQLKLRTVLFGRGLAGPWSELTMTYQRIVKPAPGEPTLLVAASASLTFDVVGPSDDYDGAGTNLPADAAIVVESESFSIAAGDTVFVSLSRASDASPSYAADIGVLRITGVVVGG